MNAWHAQASVDESIFTSAARVHRFEIEADVPAETVWACLVSDKSIGAWPTDPGLGVRCEWTSPRPFGVGTTRVVTLPTRLRLRERFFRWEEGSRYSFAALAANRRGLAAFAEDYQVIGGDGVSTLVWTVAIEPELGVSGLFGPAALLNGWSLARTARAARRHFSRRERSART
ncbi:SRPBCC family protein [Nocardioides marmoraquaticus]